MALVRTASQNQRSALRLRQAPGLDSQAEVTLSSAGAADLPVIVTEDHATVDATPTITAGLYTLGAAVGGLLTFASVVHASGNGGRITDVVVIDKSAQEAPLELVLFDRAFTPTADGSLFAPSNADLAHSIGVIPILPQDYTRFSANSMAWIRNVNKAFTAVGTANIYGQLVTRGTPTFSSVSDITIRLTVVKD